MAEYIDRKLAIAAGKYAFGIVGQKIMRGVPYVVNLAPVVFCRDCIYRDTQLDKDGGVHIACSKMGPNDFCSYGSKTQ